MIYFISLKDSKWSQSDRCDIIGKQVKFLCGPAAVYEESAILVKLSAVLQSLGLSAWEDL